MSAVACRTRVRGFAPWTPRADARVLLEQVLAVLDEYRAHLPITLRQLFYRWSEPVATRRPSKRTSAWASC